jgi:hypothetical protein
LLPASDDPWIASRAAQAEFSQLRAFLRARGVPTSTAMYYRDGDPNAGGFAGEYVMPLACAIEPTMETFLVVWLHARSGRKARLRVGDAEVEARSVEEAQTFLSHVLQLRQAPLPVDERQA